ncbi:hypothetical protein [Polynucleobacter antarcticus]|uniref:Uncharacterized protein n=1 Tax=Polynucleobacter antarcticus TaxID=1743162 RepID=A0A6M9PTL8_9BURK|nr:hypothetical protein [Polynucleobacter antarcticus]QKM62135.1 hypothetical protein DCO16_03005 [Polynucleobacter antarcticus]
MSYSQFIALLTKEGFIESIVIKKEPHAFEVKVLVPNVEIYRGFNRYKTTYSVGDMLFLESNKPTQRPMDLKVWSTRYKENNWRKLEFCFTKQIITQSCPISFIDQVDL